MEPYGIVHCTPCKHQQKNSQKSGKNANENWELLINPRLYGEGRRANRSNSGMFADGCNRSQAMKMMMTKCCKKSAQME
jgi:hypothetical protein